MASALPLLRLFLLDLQGASQLLTLLCLELLAALFLLGRTNRLARVKLVSVGLFRPRATLILTKLRW